VCQGISGFQAGYLDCQYFICRDTLVTLQLTDDGFLLRTHTKNWFPWKGEGLRFPARFEDEGGLARMRAGTVKFWLKAGQYRTSDFFFETAFIRNYADAYPRLGILLEGPLLWPAKCLEGSFLLDGVQKRILDDIHHGDNPSATARHFITLKATEYFMRAMNQLRMAVRPRALHDTDPEKQVAERIADYLREHLTTRLSLKALASMMLSNTVYIQRAFKARYGMTIHQFHCKQRLDRARFLMTRDEDATDTEIARKSGFCDASAFSRAFNRAFGMRPHQYRKHMVTRMYERSPAEQAGRREML
jgi:AraC-like DNA-binding protein